MTHKSKHIPQRTCVICHQKYDKRQLTRVVRTADGIFIDPTGKREGRGAYLCDSVDCRNRAMTTDTLGKALRTKLKPDDLQRLRDVAQ